MQAGSSVNKDKEYLYTKIECGFFWNDNIRAGYGDPAPGRKDAIAKKERCLL